MKKKAKFLSNYAMQIVLLLTNIYVFAQKVETGIYEAIYIQK